MAGQRQPVSLTPNTEKLVNLQFVPKSVRVDNPSSYWVYFTAFRRWIPPFVYGVTISLPTNQTDIDVDSSKIPPNVSAITPPTLANIQLVFADEDIGEASGTNLPFQNQRSLGAVLAGQTVSFSLPTGTLGIALVTDANVTVATATGGQTGIVYLTQTPPSRNPLGNAAPVWSSLDNTIAVTSIGGTSILVALFTLAAVDVQGNGINGAVLAASPPPQTVGTVLAGTFRTFPLPIGVLAIAIVTDNAVTAASAVGAQSGITYLQQLPYSQQQGAVANGISAPIWSSVDTSITVSSTGGTTRLIALFSLTAVDVSGNGIGGSVLVSRGPAIRSIVFGTALNPGGISGSFGNMVYLRRAVISVDLGGVAGFALVYLCSNDGSAIYGAGALRVPAGTSQTLYFELDDITVKSGVNGQYGLAIKLDAVSSGACNIYGTIYGS